MDVLTAVGARQTADETVTLPRELIEKTIETTPATFVVFDRRGGSGYRGR